MYYIFQCEHLVIISYLFQASQDSPPAARRPEPPLNPAAAAHRPPAAAVGHVSFGYFDIAMLRITHLPGSNLLIILKLVKHVKTCSTAYFFSLSPHRLDQHQQHGHFRQTLPPPPLPPAPSAPSAPPPPHPIHLHRQPLDR